MAAEECDFFSSLPLCCTLDVFARLSSWERLRVRAVSRAWRATLSNGFLWRDVDLSRRWLDLGRGNENAIASFLTAVGRVANGHITRLDFSWQMSRYEKTVGVFRCELLLRAMHAFVDAHAGTLRHLVFSDDAFASEEARAFFQRKPREVERVDMDVACFYDEAKPLLCSEPPYETLRLRSLRVSGRRNNPQPINVFPNESALLLARYLPSCACLEELTLKNAPLHVPPVWEALSAACLKLTKLSLSHCGLDPRSVPGLVLLLSNGCLASLSINHRLAPLRPLFENLAELHLETRYARTKSSRSWN